MPQFDPAVWMPQLVWLAITFIALYLLMARVALPRVGEVIEDREARIGESLRRAERLKLNAEDAVAAYEKTMIDVRAKAADEVRMAREEAAHEAAERHAALGARLASEIEAAEARIRAAQNAALTGLREVAVGVASAAVDRLIGTQVEPAAVASAVDASMAEQRR